MRCFIMNAHTEIFNILMHGPRHASTGRLVQHRFITLLLCSMPLGVGIRSCEMTTIANILRGACKYRALGKEQQRKLSEKKRVGVRGQVTGSWVCCVANHNTHLLNTCTAAVDVTRMGSCNRCIHHDVERCGNAATTVAPLRHGP